MNSFKARIARLERQLAEPQCCATCKWWVDSSDVESSMPSVKIGHCQLTEANDRGVIHDPGSAPLAFVLTTGPDGQHWGGMLLTEAHFSCIR
jgi:hypothetical protein